MLLGTCVSIEYGGSVTETAYWEQLDDKDLRELEDDQVTKDDEEVAPPQVRDVESVSGLQVCASGNLTATGSGSEERARLIDA